MSIKRIIFLILLVLALFIIGNFVTSIYTLWHKKDLLIIAKNQLQKEEAENRKLKDQLSRVKSRQFVEEEARDKLFMVKQGESTVVIPTIAIQNLEGRKVTKKIVKPNWQQWWVLFFDNS